MENTGIEVGLSRLEEVLREHERVVVAGAPRIYRYETLRELAEKREAVFAEKPGELLREGTEGREIVIPDFYGFFNDYRCLSEKEEVKKRLREASRVCISLRLYELLWLVYEYPGEVEKLCERLREWKGVLLSVGEEEAEEVLKRRAGDYRLPKDVEGFVEESMELLRKKKYNKKIDNMIKKAVSDKKSREKIRDTLVEIFGDEIEKDGRRHGFLEYKYVSLLPGLVLIKDAAKIVSIEQFFELLGGEGSLKRLIRVGREFVADLSLSTAIKYIHSGIESIVERLREGEWGDILKSLLGGRWQPSTALAGVAPYAGLQLTLMATLLSIWGLMRRDENKVKEFLKKVQELPEEHLLLIEENFGFKPRSLVYLKQVMEGDVDRLLRDVKEIEDRYRVVEKALQELGERVEVLERQMEELWEMVVKYGEELQELRERVEVVEKRMEKQGERIEKQEERIDGIEERVEKQEEKVDKLWKTVKRDVYRRLEDFEEKQRRVLGVLPEYIPPKYMEKRDKGEDVWVEGENAVERVKELLSNGADIVCIYGDGGVGKSRLILELGRELRQSRDVFYIASEEEFREREFERDTVVFVDDAALKDTLEFAKLADLTERGLDKEHRVQVVLTERRQFRGEVEDKMDKLELRGLRKAELELKPLGKEEVVRLLAEKVSRETAERIYEYTGGNPYFSLLVAAHLRGEERVGEESIRDALEDEVEKRYLGWVREKEEREEAMREKEERKRAIEERKEAMRLLKAAAVLGGIDRKLLGRIGGERWEEYNGVLLKLKDSGILELRGSGEYGFSVDMIGDYLRCRVIMKDAFPDSCDVFLGYFKHAPERVKEAVRGLVALHGNTLMERVFPRLGERVLRCAKEVVEAGMERAELGDVLRACAGVIFVMPEAIPEGDGLIKRLGERVRESRERELAEPLFEIASAFFFRRRMKEGKEYLRELRELHERYGEREVREWLASALNNAVAGCAKHGRVDDAEEYLRELRELHERYDDREVRAALAKALNNAVWGCANANRPDDAGEYLRELRELHERYGEREVREWLASALNNAVWGCAKHGRVDDAEEYLRELRELHERYDDREVRVELASALNNAVWGCANANRPDDAEEYLRELRELHERYDDREVREWLAKALNNAVAGCAKHGRVDDAEEYLRELRELHIRYGYEEEVREALAIALSIAVVGWAGIKGEPDRAVRYLEELEGVLESGLPLSEDTLKLVVFLLGRGRELVLKYAASAPEFAAGMLKVMLKASEIADKNLTLKVCNEVILELDRQLERGKLSTEAYQKISEVCQQD